MRLIQNRDKQPNHYDVILDKKCTVKEAVDMILEDKDNWGCIVITSGRRYKIDTCPQYKYRRGELKGVIPDDISTVRVTSISAFGQHTNMSYMLHIPSTRGTAKRLIEVVEEKDTERDEDWKHCITVAEQLCYPQYVIDALKAEPDANNRNRILKNARLR